MMMELVTVAPADYVVHLDEAGQLPLGWISDNQFDEQQKREREKIKYAKEIIAAQHHEHWRKIHTTRMTSERFEKWVNEIPGCSACQKDFRKILETNPPRFDDWEKWTWEVHNAVNEKIGKQSIDWQEACKLWGWNHEPNGLDDAETEDSRTDIRRGSLREVSRP